ncbi:DcaP family trimeric outer membrane transporter [Alterisphingorhabdus coralli]|uniref:DcaP family trimeric outer membrane transporter n=1 Tax=Alterisphingorhabdus coralli TaxID=3071408 RepID=A0AA97F7L3_9SPHN|nr:DcaP family trimeric outer membrane transporter [Parasphingorhabdus sp. SCSIO 66989]WOE74946.1 DcaP family trimeric outer membrane transporter [Parasphingorhabdus sp. SCSIO 66989]
MAKHNKRTALFGLLLAASCLTPAPAIAQETSIEERLDRLESLVETLITRMDQKEQQGEQDRAMVAEVKQAVEETRELAERSEQAAQKVEDVELSIVEVNDKLIANRDVLGDGFKVGNTSITYGGYVKMDAISERTSGGVVDSSSIARDFLIPGLIPVGGDPSGFDTDFNIRQTRFFFKTATDVGDDHTLSSVIELDFMVTAGGNERISNSFIPRVRQAYLTYDNWLFGQTWSTFQDVGALPETLDFIGVTPGTVFDRQPLIRYTNGGLQVAVEQPETTVTTPTGARVIGNNDNIPDVVLRYNYSRDWGRITLAGIGRSLSVDENVFNLESDSAFGYGISLSGKINVGERDDIRFMASAGDGIGRYVGLNLVNDAAVRPDGSLDPIATYSGFLAYRHFWSPKLRTTIAGSYFKADNPIGLTTDGVTDQSTNGFINLVYSPVPPLNLGIEYLYADRELENGMSGNLQKIQVSAQYSF